MNTGLTLEKSITIIYPIKKLQFLFQGIVSVQNDIYK